MSEEQCKYYRFGYSGCNFLSVNRSVYTQSELLSNGVIREVICDKEEKWMKVRKKRKNSKNWNKLKLNGLQRGVTIDLNEHGDRWEGDSLNGNPFGYGCLYNSENQLIYSGFIFEGLKVCYGMEMYGDIGLVEYEGGFYKGNRYGNGKLYDKKNKLIYEGEWYMNNPLELYSLKVKRKLKEEDIYFGLENLEIGKNCGNYLNCFKLIGFDHLKKLIFHKNSLKNLDSLVISNNKELKTIKIECGYGGYGDESRNTGVFHNVKNVEISSIFLLMFI